MEKIDSLYEKLIKKILIHAENFKVPIICGAIFGLLAHAFSFYNKYVQMDEIVSTFGKGTTYNAGRWGLELVDILFPDYSMPWIYGILMIAMLTVSACIILSVFKINNRLLQGIFSSLFICFPAVTGLCTQPYLSASNAFAIMLSTLTVQMFINRKNHVYLMPIAGIVFTVISLSIYQAYISLTASLLVVFFIYSLLYEKADEKQVVADGLICAAFLIASVVVYGLITMLSVKIHKANLINYASNDSGVLWGIRLAYSAFAGYFIKGYFGFVNGRISAVLHVICALICMFFVIRRVISLHSIKKALIVTSLIIVLPLSINCMYLASSVDILGPLVFMSFISIYVMVTVISEHEYSHCGADIKKFLFTRDFLCVSMTIVIIGNVFFANKIYFKMYMQSRQMASFYTTVMTKVLDLKEYDKDCFIIFSGSPDEITYNLPEIDSSAFIGPVPKDVFSVYSRDYYVKYYLGYDINIPNENVRNYYCSVTNEDFSNAPCYPAEGSIYRTENAVVVKFS